MTSFFGNSYCIKKLLTCALTLLASALNAQVITTDASAAAFDLTVRTAIYTDSTDEVLVQKTADLLQSDIEKVTGHRLNIIHQQQGKYVNVIVIGTIKKSSLLKALEQSGKISFKKIVGKWEAGQVELVSNPFPSILNLLVIAGSDRRGTAYAALELSKQMGVSPWYWWADVPVKKRSGLFIKQHSFFIDAPEVKYRGIFINDEAPALVGWAKEKFGGINHGLYEKVFELILRLKGNYLWPAMWANAFNDDDPLDPALADDWGIVMGTSHHEPMLRAQQEWQRYGNGAWNYQTNEFNLKSFWKKGIQNMGNHESIVTIGMRGDGDKPMTTATSTGLLENIVKEQRQIIEQVTNKPASATPQLWALYKEVQDYYDKGMRVPDDVTLLFCDDNWGNIRKLPKLDAKPRSGGYGIYYHFDYVGGPRNYKWLNTNSIARVWEQMHLAYEYNVRQVWIVNVGDIKPMEFPTSFFLDYAWAPSRINANGLEKYTEQWATAQFGEKYAADIAFILNKYTQYNSRKKPELLEPGTYSFDNNNEAGRIVSEYNNLLLKAEKINAALAPQYKDAFFELVLHPVKACANLNEMYYAAGMNKLYASKNMKKANEFADKVKELFLNDSLISVQYHQLANGKWDHMMDQTHIGYTSWQQPAFNVMPQVSYISNNDEVVMDTTLSKKSLQYNKSYQLQVKQFKKIKKPVFGFADYYASMNADHFTKAVGSKDIHWQCIKYIGRDGNGITAMPVTSPVKKVSLASPHLEYDFISPKSGNVTVAVYCSPTLNFNDGGLRYGISIDGEIPQVINLNGTYSNKRWEQWVTDNIMISSTTHHIPSKGMHTLKFWLINPGIVLQKLVVDKGNSGTSYLGPLETMINADTVMKDQSR